MNLRSFFLLPAACLLASVAAAAAEPAAPSFAPPAGATGLLNVFASLLVVIAAVLLCGWLYRRTQSMRRGPGGEVFRVLASQALGPRERVVVVEIGGKQLVLGMTATQVNTLHVFDEPIMPHAKERSGQAHGGRIESAFAERLRAMLRGDR